MFASLQATTIFILTLLLQSLLSSCDGCTYYNVTVPLQNLQTAWTLYGCQQVILNNAQVTCSNSNSSPVVEGLTVLTLRNIRTTQTQFLCDNLSIQATIIAIDNTQFGMPITGKCCSFLNSYVVNLNATSYLSLSGYIAHTKNKYSTMIFTSQKSLDILSGTSLVGGSIAVHAVSAITVNHATLTSLYTFCVEDIQMPNVQLYNSQVNFLSVVLSDSANPKYVVNSLFSLSNQSNQTQYDLLFNALQYSYSMLIFSESAILYDSSNIDSSRIGLIGTIINVTDTSTISANGKGCPASYGQGQGLFYDTVENCQPSGANQASYGGVGLPEIGLNDQAVLNCMSFLTQSRAVLNNYPYSYSMVYEGSGGAFKGQTKSFRQLGNEGAGGGFILILASLEIAINGVIQADGQGFASVQGSGGSGGAITVKSNSISGTGTISVNGGASDPSGFCGEGAGGIITISQLSWNFTSGRNQFNGTIVRDRGNRDLSKISGLSAETLSSVRASIGSFISPICSAGYEPQLNGQCTQCRQGFYKNGIVGKCKPCPQSKTITLLAKGIEGSQVKFDDLTGCFGMCDTFSCDPLRFYVKNVMGAPGIIYLVCYFTLICIGYILRRILRMKAKKVDSIPIQHVKYDFGDSEFARECRESDIFSYKDLLYHKYRLQFYGQNSAENNWFLQLRIPEGTEHIFDQREYTEFAQKINASLKWKKIDVVILRILNYLYYPLYWFWLLKIQKKIYNTVNRKIHDEPYPRFLKGSHVINQEYIRMKITKSDDYSLLALDLFNFRKRNQKHFKVTMPTIIHFSGEGSFLKPYYIWPRDHFLQSVFYSTNSRRIIDRGNPIDVSVFCANYKYHMQNSQIFENFIQELNKFSNAIDYLSSQEILLQSFKELVALTRTFNDNFLTYIDLKVHLLIIEIPFEDVLDAKNKSEQQQQQQFPQQITRNQRITILEKEDSNEFEKAILNLQSSRLLHRPFDYKLSLFIFSTSEDLEDLKESLNPELEIDQDSAQLMNQPLLLQQHYSSTPALEAILSSQLKYDYNIPYSKSPSFQPQSAVERESYIIPPQIALYPDDATSVREPSQVFQQAQVDFQEKETVEDMMQQMIEKEEEIEIAQEESKKRNNEKVKHYNYRSQSRSKFQLFLLKVDILIGFVRYELLAHKNSKTDKEILIGALVSLIILDTTATTFFFSNLYYADTQGFLTFDFILVFAPFPFVPIIAPLAGLLLLTNQSYGLGKTYFIFNLMALIVMIISLILTFAEISVIGVQYPIIILKMFSILFKTLISRCGTYSLLALNKLNRTNIIKN